ncbi:PREDICTED: 21 kDa protein-like [Erythranthe guttata]|nr:PREDICTED: 21 kDa protein-like [Erythranthe guttata]|eukprot:XP_012841027.1 PREDICTED: 21 kDa protein-like [Erythranthe guttata]
MLKLSSILILLSLLYFHHTFSTATKPSSNTNHTNTANDDDVTNFIKAECRAATLYPSLCIQCLSTYTSTTTPLSSHKQLAQAALSVSLSRARSAATFISKAARIRGLKPMEYRAVKDCVENMASTVEQLSRAVKELGGWSGTHHQVDFNWHESNVESWVGAALTFQNTCLDGFSSTVIGGSVEVAVRVRVIDCAQVTSNALALVHRYAAKHKLVSTTSSQSTVNTP